MEYRTAREAQRIANDTVIPQWHPELINAAIAYVDVDRITSMGSPVLAVTAKASGLVNYLTDYNLIVKINREAWDLLTEPQKLALVDRELEKVGVDEETGNYVMRPYDVEEFSAIIERHGLWYDSVRDFIRTAGQLNLFDEPAKTNGAATGSVNDMSIGAPAVVREVTMAAEAVHA